MATRLLRKLTDDGGVINLISTRVDANRISIHHLNSIGDQRIIFESLAGLQSIATDFECERHSVILKAS